MSEENLAVINLKKGVAVEKLLENGKIVLYLTEGRVLLAILGKLTIRERIVVAARTLFRGNVTTFVGMPEEEWTVLINKFAKVIWKTNLEQIKNEESEQ